MGRGDWDDPFARATRGLRREGWVAWPSSCSRNAHDRNVLVRRAHSRIDQATPLNRKTSELGRISLEGYWQLPKWRVGIGRPSPGLMARLGVPVGGWVRKQRAVGIIPATSYKRGNSLRPCPRNGASRRAGVGRVKCLIVLISLSGLSSARYSKAFLMRAAAQTVFQRGRRE
jgi:hypothetical protein